MTGTGISSSRAFAQKDSETDLDNLALTNASEALVDTTLTNGSGVQGDTSGVEFPQQQCRRPNMNTVMGEPTDNKTVLFNRQI